MNAIKTSWAFLLFVGFIIFFTFTFFIGCESTISPGKQKSISHGIDNLFHKSGSFKVYANLITYSWERHYLANGSEFVINESVAQADFYRDNVVGAVDAGDVKINNISIMKRTHDISPDGYSFEYKSSTLSSNNVPIYFNGMMQTWQVAGSNDFESFTDSLRSPYYRVAITTPIFNSTYSKSSGVPVSWSVGSNPYDSIYVRIQGQTTIAYKIVANTGNTYFSPSELSTISLGKITVEIFDGNAFFKDLPSGKTALFAAYSVYSVDLNLLQ